MVASRGAVTLPPRRIEYHVSNPARRATTGAANSYSWVDWHLNRPIRKFEHQLFGLGRHSYTMETRKMPLGRIGTIWYQSN